MEHIRQNAGSRESRRHSRDRYHIPEKEEGIEMNQYKSFPQDSPKRERRKVRSQRPENSQKRERRRGRSSFPENSPKREQRRLRSPRQKRFSTDYRGFSTSITDMFRYPEMERVDCCSIACFGCLQADRNRYLVIGKKPPTLCRRFCVHVVLPMTLFGMAIFVAFNVPDPLWNNILCYGWVFVMILYFISQCDRGSMKRGNARRNLLFEKHTKLSSGREWGQQRRSNRESEDSEYDEDDEEYLMGQTHSDLSNASGLWGCYRVDRNAEVATEEKGEITFCTRIFSCLTNAFCGVCGIYFLCCGFCGVAQEAREIETLVRPGELKIDYVTMQPMMEYYPKIYEARNRMGRPRSWWYNRLSSFSQQTVMHCILWLVLLFAWSLTSDRLNHSFGPQNFIVLFLTLLQSFIILAAVYWKYTKDVSIDALLKFFAAGFCLSTTFSMCFELVLGVMVRFGMAFLMAVSGIELVENDGYSLFRSANGGDLYSMQTVNYSGGYYREYLKAYGNDHPIEYTIYLFVVSFILAALIEETCKYFGYRMVDHPDFHTQTEIEEAVKCYEKNREEVTVVSFSQQNRTHQSRAAAITVSMIAVALGFTCCENLVYVFIYGKAQYSYEIVLLLVRSLFPVHPIAAALQSIQVCKRDLENQKLKLGKIVLPGVLFHGSYDFLLLWIDYMGNRKGNYADYNDGARMLSRFVSFLVLIAGLVYYFRASKQQKRRLESLEIRAIVSSNVV